jgi:hypothetical protein
MVEKKVSKNRLLKRIFGPKREKTAYWEFNDLYSLPNIIRLIKSIRIRMVGHLA